MINKATKPLEDKIAELQTQIVEMCTSQAFISDKHDNLKAEYSSILQTNMQQKSKIKEIKKRMDNLHKMRWEDELKIDDLEQY